MVHYVVLLAGFFVGLAALGVDLTKITILAGAFTVGIGFGLQTVINNFVCGLIPLFERPIKRVFFCDFTREPLQYLIRSHF
jgi:potassium-dependent mechanosensitive channel